MADFGLEKCTLLYTTHAESAIEEIESTGSHVLMHIMPNLLIVQLSAGTRADGFKASIPKLPEKLSSTTRAHVNSWNRVVKRYSGGKVPVNPETVPSRSHEPCGAGGADVKGHATQIIDATAVPNNDTLTGKVKVYLLIISCLTGPSITNEAEINTVWDNFIGALSFLSNAPPDGFRPTLFSGYQAVSIPGDVWANNIRLNNSPMVVFCQNQLFCFYQNTSQQLCYTTINRTATDWSSEIPVNGCTLSESPGVAALGNDIFVVYQQTGGGGALFYSVYTTNGNTWKHRNKPVNNKELIGWSPCVVAYKNLIYVFFASKWNDHRLHYMIYTPSSDSWSGVNQVVMTDKNGNTVYSLSQSRPSAVVVGTTLRVYHMGWENNYEYCDIFDGNTWKVDTVALPNVWLTSGPAAYGDGTPFVYTYHQEANNGQALYQNLYWGWPGYSAGDTEVAGSTLSYSPSVAGWFDSRGKRTMCVLMRDYNNGRLKYRQFYFPTSYNPKGLQECIFRDPALAMLNCDPGSDGIKQYVARFCNAAPATTKGYAIITTKFPLPEDGRGYQPTYQPLAITTWQNSTWGPGQLDRTMAHESCHVFGALDEYDGSCTCSQTGGVNRVRNGNCDGCPGGGQECIMYHDNWKMCRFTQGQLGYPFSGDKEAAKCPGKG